MISSEKLEGLSLESAKEIGETGANINEALENLKKYLEENYKELKLPENPDELLLRFLRASKFNVPRASKQVSQYFKLLHQMKDIHHLFNSKSVQQLFRDRVFAIFKERDSKGRIVVAYRQELVPPAPNWFEVVFAAYFLIADYLHRISIDTQRIGIVFVVHLSGFSWSHCRQLSPGRVIKVTKMITQAFPARTKAFEFVNNPEAFGYMLAIAKPFFPKKIKERLHLYGSNLESFYEHVEFERGPRGALPKYLGGEVDDDECMDMEIFSKLVEEDGYYEDLLKHGYS